MSFLRRLLSTDYRRALAAEAAGDYKEAARRYALAGDRAKVSEMHLRRAERAESRADELAALRDALAWSPQGTPLRRRVARALADTLVARAREEGAATARDREALAEAARHYEEAEAFAEAGELWERLGDPGAAARAYERGGHLEPLEAVLRRDRERSDAERRTRDAFREYELSWQDGDRDRALAALRVAAEHAADPGVYRGLLDRQEARRIGSGRIVLRRRPSGSPVVACGGARVTLGRDALCDLVLRSMGISRVHAEVRWGAEAPRVRDAGSKNGTFLDGLPLVGETALVGEGELALGDDCVLAFRARGGLLRLEVVRGMDKGLALLCAAPGAAIDLEEPLGLAATLRFDAGVPLLSPKDTRPVRLSGETARRPTLQLVREDVIAIADVEVEVL